MSQSHMSRREFVQVVTAVLGGIIAAVVGLPAVGYLISPSLKGRSTTENWIPIGPVDNIPIGAPTLFSFTRTKINGWEKTVNSYGVFVVRNEADEIRVFSNVCTHLACRVNWDGEASEFKCPCHAAVFDVNGNVVNGPPPRPLDMYEAKVDENGTLTILFTKG